MNLQSVKPLGEPLEMFSLHSTVFYKSQYHTQTGRGVSGSGIRQNYKWRPDVLNAHCKPTRFHFLLDNIDEICRIQQLPIAWA